MAATQQKRLREDSSETLEFDDSNSKRQKPHNNILSLLDEDDEQDEESRDGFSAIFTTLQQEISSSAAIDLDFLPFAAAEEAHHQQTTTSASDEEEGLKSVMRHLLEASDDELGIPNYTEDGKIVEINSAENFQFGNFVDNGLWELEDVAANYYAMLQSQLFM